VRPHETLFRAGDSSEPGIFIVVEGRLGVFLQARAAPAPGGGAPHRRESRCTWKTKA